MNFDGFTDLLIGAPLHTGFQPDEGVVYVYMGALNMVNKLFVHFKNLEKFMARRWVSSFVRLEFNNQF